MKNRILYMFLALSLGLSYLSSKQAMAEIVTLRFGSQVDKEKLQKIFEPKSVKQFIQSIEGPDLKVIGIRKKAFSQSEITIPEKYWKDTPQYIEEYFKDAKKTINAEYVAPRHPILNNEISWILTDMDIPLPSLIHEYIHYLVEKNNPDKKIFSYVNRATVRRKDLPDILQQSYSNYEKIYETYKQDKSNEKRRVDFYYVQITRLLDTLENHNELLEEIEVESWILDHAKELNLTAVNKAKNAGYILDSFRNFKEIVSEISDWFVEATKLIEDIKDPSLLDFMKKEKMDEFSKSLNSNLEKAIKIYQDMEATLIPSLEGFSVYEGDINFDSNVDQKDRDVLISVIKGLKQFPGETLIWFDLNDDHEISEKDLEYFDKLLEELKAQEK